MTSFRGHLTQIGSMVLDAIESTRHASLAKPEELPVVTRLMVEVRSDGSRTLARGMLEDHVTGETHTVEARGSSPGSLAISLVTRLVTSPMFERTLQRALRANTETRDRDEDE